MIIKGDSTRKTDDQLDILNEARVREPPTIECERTSDVWELKIDNIVHISEFSVYQSDHEPKISLGQTIGNNSKNAKRSNRYLSK